MAKKAVFPNGAPPFYFKNFFISFLNPAIK